MLFICVLPLSCHKYTYLLPAFLKLALNFSQSTSLPICNNVFYSSFPKMKSHRGQREGQHCTELLCLLQELLPESFGLPTVTMPGVGSFAHQEKRDPQEACSRSPKSPHSFLEQQDYCRELPKLNRLSFPES